MRFTAVLDVPQINKWHHRVPTVELHQKNFFCLNLSTSKFHISDLAVTRPSLHPVENGLGQHKTYLYYIPEISKKNMHHMSYI